MTKTWFLNYASVLLYFVTPWNFSLEFARALKLTELNVLLVKMAKHDTLWTEIEDANVQYIEKLKSKQIFHLISIKPFLTTIPFS